MTNEELFEKGAIEELYIRNEKFIYYHIKHFNNLKIDQEELISCSNLAFMKAVKTFDPNKSKWLSYFSKCITNEILMNQRKNKRYDHLISLDKPLKCSFTEKQITLKDIITDGIDIGEKVEDQVTVEEILALTNHLSRRDREALRLHLLGAKQRDIGEKVGTSQANVSRLIKKITLQLRSDYQRGNFR